MEGLAFTIFAYLAAAVFAVILSRRLGLGSVVGYIAAGILVGPILHVADGGSGYLEQFSEFGIVMMLFLIGLEIDPQMVWRLRGKLIGLGGLQVVLTLALVCAVAVLCGLTWQQGALFGCVAALSSTAIVLQTPRKRACWNRTAGAPPSPSCCFRISRSSRCSPPFRFWREGTTRRQRAMAAGRSSRACRAGRLRW